MDYATGNKIARSYWQGLMFQGIIAILFGLAIIVWPHLTVIVFVYLFGAFLLVDGIAALIVSPFMRETTRYWWIVLLIGLFCIGAGLVTFFWPHITAIVLLYLVAIWAIVVGILEIALPFSPGNSFSQEWPYAIGGAIFLLLGIFLILRPGAGILSIVWLVGLCAIVGGILTLIRAFQARSALKHPVTTIYPRGTYPYDDSRDTDPYSDPPNEL
ncbi:MAG: HdeD family acid-resistance protein [Chloroflexi bacterium]|nr:HdeD family acid-resistance protein [Chloroflexota bacterium]